MKFSKLSAVATTVFLVACQTAQPIRQVTTAVPTDPNVVGGDVLAARRAAGEDVPALRGSNLLTIRTFHHAIQKGGKYKKGELVGATCAIESDGFKGQVQTPGQIRVPDYGYASRLVTIRCEMEGYKQGFTSVQAIDVDKAARLNSGAGGGLIGVVAMGVINAVDDEKNNKFEYPQASVYMNRIGCETAQGGCRSR